MVYSVMYYATEAIVRAIVGLILKIHEHLRKGAIVRAKEKKPSEPPPRFGFFKTTNEAGATEYVWRGRSTRLNVQIPDLLGGLDIRAHERPPVEGTRLYFSYIEAASKDWFKEIEWLAKQAEKRAG